MHAAAVVVPICCIPAAWEGAVHAAAAGFQRVGSCGWAGCAAGTRAALLEGCGRLRDAPC